LPFNQNLKVLYILTNLRIFVVMMMRVFVLIVILSLCESFIRSTSRSRSSCSKVNSISNNKEKIIQNVKKSSGIAIGSILLGLLSKKNTAIADSSVNSKIVTQPLPYDYDALEPYISKATMKYHHDKHYSKYVATTNQLITDNPDIGNDSDLISIMKKSHNKNPVLFNNAAQSWNHEFYWKCMKKRGGGGEKSLPPKLKKAIEKSFGSYEEFAKQFTGAGNGIFGSGWTWLVQNKAGDVEIVSTGGAENPIVDNKVPLLTMDVWEHAYYLDYQNMRATYINNFLDQLVDWQFVQNQMKS